MATNPKATRRNPGDGSGLAVPLAMLVGAMVSFQTGASFAKTLFPIAGPTASTAVRLVFAAAILTAMRRPRLGVLLRREGWPLLAYGLSLGGMNLLFYMALARLPLGLAVAIEFAGPLTVAVFASRRRLDMVWVALAAGGLLALLPLTRSAHPLDPVGVLCALGAGVGWGAYILTGQNAGERFGGQAAVAYGTVVAAILVAPIGLMTAGAGVFTPKVLALGAVVGLLSSALPYSLEMVALVRMPMRTFSTLMSAEPAMATLVAFALLGERLSLTQGCAVLAIMAASAGAALTARAAPALVAGD